MVTLRAEALADISGVGRIEILGAFGAGKTTLAGRLRSEWTTNIPEVPGANPFWQDREALSVTGSLPYDLAFLLQHCQSVALHSLLSRERLGVCDWSFCTDRLWASSRVDEKGMRAYDEISEYLLSRVGAPRGYLYLKQPVDILVDRVMSRGRVKEKHLVDELSFAADSLEHTVRRLDPSKVLIVSDEFSIDELRQQMEIW